MLFTTIPGAFPYRLPIFFIVLTGVMHGRSANDGPEGNAAHPLRGEDGRTLPEQGRHRGDAGRTQSGEDCREAIIASARSSISAALSAPGVEAMRRRSLSTVMCFISSVRNV